MHNEHDMILNRCLFHRTNLSVSWSFDPERIGAGSKLSQYDVLSTMSVYDAIAHRHTHTQYYSYYRSMNANIINHNTN